jgi:hypothetical protein
MFEPTWTKIELFTEHNIATVMTEKLKFFTDSFSYSVRTDDWEGSYPHVAQNKVSIHV